MGLFSKKVSHKAGQVDKSRLPRHIAIIMDGNGRWAKKRGLPRTAGHKVGAETFRKIALYCKALGVEYLTIYAFSTENWKRPADEVSTLMGLLKKYMQEGKLTDGVISSIMEEEKPNQREKPAFRDERITKLIPKSVPKGKESDFVVKALEFYNRHLQRSKAQER